MSTTMSSGAQLVPELEAYARQAEAQKREAAELVRGLDDAQWRWRPRPEKWSIGEHLVHLPATNRIYLAVIDAAVADARDRGLLAPGPYRHGWLGDFFIRTLEPPVGLKVKTLKKLEPLVVGDVAAELAAFAAAQDALLGSIRAANGVDLGRATMRSPFLKLVKLSVGQAFGVLLAHNRRHFWHIRQTAAAPGFPAGARSAGASDAPSTGSPESDAVASPPRV